MACVTSCGSRIFKLLFLKDAVSTLDGTGCQRAITDKLTALDGHYASREYREYSVSKPDSAQESLNSILQNHGGIENGLHRVLDVTDGEDSP